MDTSEITYQIGLFSRALSTLEEAIMLENPSQIEKDGTIQRFEYTAELAWKTMRRFFLYKGENLEGMYPKDILKLAWERHLIDDREVWLSYIDIRNSLSHSYDHTFAEKYYPHVLDSLRYFQALLEKIESGI